MAHQGTAIDPYVRARRPARLGGAVLGGALGSAAIVAVNQAADRLGLTDLDLLRILGLTFRDPEDGGIKPAGLAWYGLWGGLLVPAMYWVGFRRLGRAGGRVGGVFGIVHYLASGTLLAATTPRRPKRVVGRGRPMGGFVSRYGPSNGSPTWPVTCCTGSSWAASRHGRKTRP